MGWNEKREAWHKRAGTEVCFGWGGKGGSVQEGEKRLKQETIKKRKGKISQRNLLFMLLSNPRIAVVRRIRALLHPLFSYLEQCV